MNNLSYKIQFDTKNNVSSAFSGMNTLSTISANEEEPVKSGKDKQA